MLDLHSASQIVDAALVQARRKGLAPMTVAALDARGAIVALKMEDGSSLLRPEIASGKAWSALAMGFGTRNLAGRAVKLPSFFGALADLALQGVVVILQLHRVLDGVVADLSKDAKVLAHVALGRLLRGDVDERNDPIRLKRRRQPRRPSWSIASATLALDWAFC